MTNRETAEQKFIDNLEVVSEKLNTLSVAFTEIKNIKVDKDNVITELHEQLVQVEEQLGNTTDLAQAKQLQEQSSTLKTEISSQETVLRNTVAQKKVLFAELAEDFFKFYLAELRKSYSALDRSVCLNMNLSNYKLEEKMMDKFSHQSDLAKYEVTGMLNSLGLITQSDRMFMNLHIRASSFSTHSYYKSIAYHLRQASHDLPK